MKKTIALLLAAALLLSACGKEPDAPQPQEETIQYAQTAPESLLAVLDLIYAKIDVKEQQDATEEELSDLFHLDPALVEEYAVRYTSGRYGVADVAIVKPVQGEAQAVLEALEQRRSDRVAQFENYDIHDAYRIAKEAEVFTRGDYVILLMLADKDRAWKIILEQIPG